MGKHRRRSPAEGSRPGQPEVVGLRIIGGSLRGRKLAYSGDARTRPMKDRVREAVFNLVGPAIVGSHAIDLFAGTGALGLEAVSRGAVRATLIERHLPTVKLIERNVGTLGVADRVQVIFGDAFVWSKAFVPSDQTPLAVFCSPPFDFYGERQTEMLELISRWAELAPPGSRLIVEADERLPLAALPHAAAWNVREYPPAVVAIYVKSSPE